MSILDKFSGKKAKAPAKTAAPKAKKAEETKADAAVAEAPAKSRGPLAREGAGDSYRILLRPVLTEKTSLQQSMGQYTFAVDNGATKVDVARAVRDLYGVKPEQVRIVNAKGKHVRFGRSQGYEKNVKKAVVTLKKGDSISVTE